MTPFSLTQSNPRIPSSLELTELIDKVLGDWAYMAVVPAGKPCEGPAPLPLEFSVSLRGPLNCLLVMRSDMAFGAELAYASTGDPSAREQGRDAFKELCNLMASHLLTKFFGGTNQGFEPFLPRPSTPESWPPIEADAESALIVERFPLEARLWVELSGGTIHE